MPQARFLSRDDANLLDPDACAAAVEAHAPSAIINAAAWTAVDGAEDNRDLAFAINAVAPGAIARAAAARGAPLVHISTDYVFDGSGTSPWHPSDPTAPLGAYGASKAAGEEAVRAAGGPHAILRTSWVFSAHGANFVKTMLRLAETRNRLTIVADQIGGPTPARAIASACGTIAGHLQSDPGATGTYHFSGAPDVSWAGFARAIFAISGHDIAVTDIASTDYPTPAARPMNSRLDCSSTTGTFGITRPDWHAGLRAVIHELGAAKNARQAP
jgi:dTDP-4-dehydrorhamnose reductase